MDSQQSAKLSREIVREGFLRAMFLSWLNIANFSYSSLLFFNIILDRAALVVITDSYVKKYLIHREKLKIKISRFPDRPYCEFAMRISTNYVSNATSSARFASSRSRLRDPSEIRMEVRIRKIHSWYNKLRYMMIFFCDCK